MHGGRTPVKTGRYSKYIKETLASALDAGSADLSGELGLARAMLDRVSELAVEFRNNGQGTAGEIITTDLARKLLGVTAKIAKTLVVIEQVRSISPQQVELVLGNIVRALQRHVEPDKLKLVINELRSMPWPADIDVVQNEQQGRPVMT